MSKRIKRTAREEGYVLVAAAVFSFVLVIGGMAVFNVATGENRAAHYQNDYWQAYFLAEAAIEEGRARLLADASWRSGFANVAAGAGTYSLTISDTAMAGLPNPVKLVGSGTVGQATRSIEVLAGVDVTAFEHSLIIKSSFNSWLRNLDVTGLVHVGQGENMINQGLDVGSSDFAVNPPPIRTEAEFYPNSTYYKVLARKSGPNWHARIYDRNEVDITTALGDSLDGKISRSGNRISYTFSGDADITHYFDRDSGVFSMAPGDSGIIVNFGEAPQSHPPGPNGYASISLSADNPLTLHTTIINSRFTGATDQQRMEAGYWLSGVIYLSNITIEPYNGLGLIAGDLSNIWGYSSTIGSSDWPALVCVTDDVLFLISATNVRGAIICWDDWTNLIGSTLTRDPGYKNNLPDYLLDISSGYIQGTLEIAEWREI